MKLNDLKPDEVFVIPNGSGYKYKVTSVKDQFHTVVRDLKTGNILVFANNTRVTRPTEHTTLGCVGTGQFFMTQDGNIYFRTWHYPASLAAIVLIHSKKATVGATDSLVDATKPVEILHDIRAVIKYLETNREEASPEVAS